MNHQVKTRLMRLQRLFLFTYRTWWLPFIFNLLAAILDAALLIAGKSAAPGTVSCCMAVNLLFAGLSFWQWRRFRKKQFPAVCSSDAPQGVHGTPQNGKTKTNYGKS